MAPAGEDRPGRGRLGRGGRGLGQLGSLSDLGTPPGARSYKIYRCFKHVQSVTGQESLRYTDSLHCRSLYYKKDWTFYLIVLLCLIVDVYKY